MRYTETENALRLSRYLDSLGAEPSTPRIREYVLGLVFFTLLMGWLDGGNLGAQIVEERHQQIVGCISQYGPGERWSRTNPLKCAPMVDAPPYILSMPLAENK